MKRPEPIFLAPLLPKIDEKLMELLKTLSPTDWDKPTLAPKWRVKDIAAHLLDGNLRPLSMLRDDYFGDTPGNINTDQALLNYLNRLNADWVKAMKRLSSKVLISLLEETGKKYCAYIQSLEPFEKATFSVGWAGETTSQNWFHIAREYTEKFHHQMQIRLAVGQDKVLLKEEWYLPYLETSMRALPHHYRRVKGRNKDLIKFTIQGERAFNWFLKYEDDQWALYNDYQGHPTSEVIIPATIAWRIFTKGIDKKTAIEQSKIIGEQGNGLKIFDMLAVMA